MQEENIQKTNNELRTIEELSKLTNNTIPTYNIPSYQRGYRWEEIQVKALLNDINNATLDKEDFYCLQPIVAMKGNANQVFDIIDGQQRLTTIYLILRYIGNTKIFSLEYNRDCEINNEYSTGKFLKNIKSRNFLEENFDNCNDEKEKYDKITNYIEDLIKDAKTIDQEYIAKAYLAIHNWAGVDNKFSRTFCMNFVDKTKVIWHEIDNIEGKENPIEVFNRLNVGKIPLKDAELIKALFLRKSNFEYINKNIYQTTNEIFPKIVDKIYENKQFQLANEWDMIEKNLQDDSLWYFLTNDDKKYNRIELIFDLMSEKPNKPEYNKNHYTYEYFNYLLQKNKEDIPAIFEKTEEKVKQKWVELHDKANKDEKSISEILWEDIVQKYYLLNGWKRNRELYHYIGYIISTKIMSLQEIYDLSQNKETVTDNKAFINELKSTIYNKILKINIKDKENKNVTIDLDIETLNYDDNYDKIAKILLLHNVLTILNNEEANTSFPFDKHKKVQCDVEHISPTNIKKAPEKDSDRKELLERQLKYIPNNQESIKIRTEIKNFIKKIENKEKINAEDFITWYEGNILGYFNKGLIKRDGSDLQQNIANLALLNKEINREPKYSNALFPQKRQILIDYDENLRYIPVCTKNAFLKYYQKDDRDNSPFIWTEANAKNYRNSIIEKINNFKSRIKYGNNKND